MAFLDCLVFLLSEKSRAPGASHSCATIVVLPAAELKRPLALVHPCVRCCSGLGAVQQNAARERTSRKGALVRLTFSWKGFVAA